MAKRTILVSDISGKEIQNTDDAATVTISYGDVRKGIVKLDVLAPEIADIAANGTRQARRGPKPRG